MQRFLTARGDRLAVLAMLVVCPVVAAMAVATGKFAVLGVAGVLALAVGTYVGLRHPMWLFWGLAVSLGGLPFGYVPGVHAPLVLLFATGSLIAVIVHRTAPGYWGPIEAMVLVSLVAGAVSVVATGRSPGDYVEYTKWAITTGLVIVLLLLHQDQLVRFGQVYSAAAALNGLFGIAMVASPNLLKVFGAFGYGKVESTRFVYSDTGTAESVRLGGLWVDPNGAGVGLLTALAVCMVVWTGWRRNVLAAAIVAALVLTLSRSAMLSAAAGVVLVVVFHPMRPRLRLQFASGFLAIAVAAIATPAVRNRALMSFTSGGDYATRMRGSAIFDFPRLMSGHWLAGLGWLRPEFKNGDLALTTNFVSNAPLLAIYRGGLVAGLAFIAVLVVGVVAAWRAVRSDSLAWAFYGGLFIGFAVIALNLDHPVVAIPPITATFSMLITFMVLVDRQRRAQLLPGSGGPPDRATRAQPVPAGGEHPGVAARPAHSEPATV